MSDARPAVTVTVPEVSVALDILANGGEQARRRLQRNLERADPSALAPLRQALIERLREERGRRVDDEGHPGSWTRSWQVCALAICAGDDRQALELLEGHLDRQREANRWVRYWTLACACERSSLRAWALAQARALAVDEGEAPLLRCLAWAILAERDDHAGACAALLWCLGEGDAPFPGEGLAAEGLVGGDEARASALRALRIIPLPQAFVRVQEIVDDAPFATHTCDAIWVMGKYRGAARAAEASQTLARFIVSHRRAREFYEMVGFAIRAIGNLGIAQTDLLLAELDSPSAGIFVEAAQALERLLGSGKAVDRLVDRLVEEEGQEAKLANALRCMHRKEVVEALDRNLRCGVDRREEAARLLLIELGGSVAIDRVQARRQDLESRRAAVSELDARQREHVKLIAVGDGAATWISVGMWVAVFLVGLIAVILGMLMVFQEGYEAWMGWALSAGGGLFSLLGKLGFSGQMVETAGARAAARLAIFTGFQRRLQHIDLLLAQRFIDGATIDVGEVEVLSKLIGAAQVETQESLLALMPSEGEVEAYRRRRSLIDGGEPGSGGAPK
ncbi:MAG: hypothetical protein H6710_22560 [Myxococcales bacterium]|nr:hypothetical protein [Myxococcales bacterium]MCB9706846.1 hypothetical protein [Myxococcales bacterium]